MPPCHDRLAPEPWQERAEKAERELENLALSFQNYERMHLEDAEKWRKRVAERTLEITINLERHFDD